MEEFLDREIEEGFEKENIKDRFRSIKEEGIPGMNIKNI